MTAQTAPSLLSSPVLESVPTGPVDSAGRTGSRGRVTADLMRKLAQSTDEVERQRLLDEVVILNMCVASAIAMRYRSRGIAEEDLRQVAYVALVKAARGFDVSSGHDFLAYAVPTIRGEVKRYFRDHGWVVRPPRRVQELQAKISRADGELCAELGRSPRPSEIAAHLDESIDDVTEALVNDGSFSPSSLDRPVGPQGELTVGELIGEEDSGQGAAEARVILAPAVRRLSARDRRILQLRFFRGWTQQEIAEDIGVTQMQVSRLLSRILADLRAELGDLDAVIAPAG